MRSLKKMMTPNNNNNNYLLVLRGLGGWTGWAVTVITHWPISNLFRALVSHPFKC